jgi:hypothetical protein
MPRRNDITKVMIIGSGPIVIGQGCEFDYSGTQACKALRKLGFEIVLVNSNPATIMTDPGMADFKGTAGCDPAQSWRSVRTQSFLGAGAFGRAQGIRRKSYRCSC